MPLRRLDRQAGLTLVEMLVAIAIFGIMSAVTYRALNTVLETREHVTEEYRRWQDVARAVAWLERDLEAIRARPVRDRSDRLAAPLIGAETLPQSGEPVIAFSRAGDLNATGEAALPSRVGYRVRDGALERLKWRGLDQAPQSVPTVTVILSAVRGLGLRFRDAAGQWQTAWPRSSGQAASGAASSHVASPAGADWSLPTAVELTIQLANGVRIAKLVPLQAGARR